MSLSVSKVSISQNDVDEVIIVVEAKSDNLIVIETKNWQLRAWIPPKESDKDNKPFSWSVCDYNSANKQSIPRSACNLSSQKMKQHKCNYCES